ncbi:MAG: Mth938-like domain-containing protein [Candidatus Bathyarchaeota archaeon]|nr:MAG: Mth938-like domain-containing protein [Candidatus Bathyarchaeota archaeon]
MIDSYDFGQIVINGRRYTSDVIVFPDRVRDSWWRREGHQLHVKDIEEAVQEEKPEVLVVGTGHSGLMKVLPETEKYLKSKGIELIAQSTREACKTFNRIVKSKRVIAALHLTC